MDIEVVVRLTYPVSNRPDAKTDETGRSAELTIEDGASGEILARVPLSPSEHLRLMAGEVTRIGGAVTSSHLKRVGLTMTAETRTLGFGTTSDEVKDAMVAARDAGWTEVKEGRSNRGITLACRRWDATKGKD